MARATHLTIATGDRIRLSFPAGNASNSRNAENDNGLTDKNEDGNEIHQEIQVSITYALDPEDTDLAALAAEKADEVKRAHEAAWHRIGAFGSQRAPAGTSEPPGPCSCQRNGNDGAADISGQPHLKHRDELRPLSGTASARVHSGRSVPQAQGLAEPPRVGFPQNGKTGYGQNGENGSYATNENPEFASKPQKILIRAKAHKVGLTTAGLEEVLWKQYRLRNVERLSKAQAAAVIQGLERYERTGRIDLIDPDQTDMTPDEDTTEEDTVEAMDDALSDDNWEPQDADVPHYA